LLNGWVGELYREMAEETQPLDDHFNPVEMMIK
jgi:hypothetical protein